MLFHVTWEFLNLTTARRPSSGIRLLLGDSPQTASSSRASVRPDGSRLQDRQRSAATTAKATKPVRALAVRFSTTPILPVEEAAAIAGGLPRASFSG